MSSHRLSLVFCAAFLLVATAFAQTSTPTPAPGAADAAPEQYLPLPAALDAALANNLGLTIERYEVSLAEAEIDQAAAAFDTTLYADFLTSETQQAVTVDETQASSSEFRRWRAGATRNFSTGTEITLEGDLSRSASDASFRTQALDYNAVFSLEVRQPLMRGLRRSANLALLRSAEAGARAASQQLRAAALNVLAATESRYWDLAYAVAQRTFRESSRAVAEALLEEAEERRRVGLGTDLEVLEARSALAARREDIIVAEADVAAAEDALLVLMGQLEETAPGEISYAVADLPTSWSEPRPFANVWRDALEIAPQLQAQEMRIAQSEYDVLRNRDSLRPNLDLFVTADLLGRDGENAPNAIDAATEEQGHAWSVGASFSMPWGYRGEKARLRQARARQQQAELRYYDVRQELLRDVRQAWRNVVTGGERLAAAEASLRLQEETFAQRRAEYEAGLSTLRRVEEAQRDLDIAQLRYLVAARDLAVAEIALARLDGRLLARHGYAWDDLDALGDPPTFLTPTTGN